MIDMENRRLGQGRNRHIMIMNNLKKKEENWNGRFYVQERNESMERNRGVVNERQKLLQRLHEVYSQNAIPDFHKELFIESLKTNPKPQQAIVFEIDEVHNKKSHIQNCLNAIEVRENCYAQLQQLISQLFGQHSDQMIQKASELITHLRILSINVVEQVIIWRQYLMKYLINQHSQQSISLPFMFQGDNYLFKMRKDIINIQTSQLCQYFAFQYRNDPFFLAITKQSDDKNLIVQYISKPLLKRAKNCETILLEEQSVQPAHHQKSKELIRPERPLMAVGKIRPKRPTSFKEQLSVAEEVPANLKKIDISPIGESKQGSSDMKALNKEQSRDVLISVRDTQSIASKQSPLKDSPQKETIVDKQIPQNYEGIIQCNLKDQNVIAFLHQVPEVYQKSWRAEAMNELHASSEESYSLAIYSQNTIKAIALIHLDTKAQNERRLILSNFSVNSQFKELLSEILTHMWSIDSCQEIRMQLYHYDQDTQYCANKEITAQLKELGFKWKIVQSLSAEIRFTVMAIRRSNTAPDIKLYDPIFLRHLYFNEDTKLPENNTFQSNICQAQLDQKLAPNELTDKLTAQSFVFNGCRLYTHNKLEFQQHLSSNLQQNLEIQNNEITSSFGKECYRWKTFSLARGHLLYNKIPKGIASVASSNGTQVYLIQTDQPNVNVFIYQAQNCQNYQNILQDCQTQELTTTDLYIPQFETQLSVKSGSYSGIGNFSTAYCPKYAPIQSQQGGIVIQAPFVFGMINDEFNEIAGLPTLVFVVKAEDCLK